MCWRIIEGWAVDHISVGGAFTTQAPYYIANKEHDHEDLMCLITPPKMYPELVNGLYVHHPVPELVQMVPRVPFAYEINGDENRVHTIGAVHTFESLRHEPEFWEIYGDTVLGAKGLRGCRPVGNDSEVFPITDFNLKTNDRSPNNLSGNSKEGSYNMVNTLLKGVGPGVVLPAMQFEFEVTEFNSEDMNVVGFGGLDPNSTSCQMNISGVWQMLANVLGLQDVSPLVGSDGGRFLLARAGIYVRELNCWALFIFYDGVDIHTGISPTTTQSREAFKQWVDTDLEPAWKLTEYGHFGVVQYASEAAHSCNTYISMTLSQRFSNFGADQHHLSIQRNFATHSQEILGGQESWANRLGREIFYQMWNQLQTCNLNLEIDPNDLMQSITFRNSSGQKIPLKSLPFHPVKDAERIALWRGYYEYFRLQCKLLHIPIEKSQLETARGLC
ncbi:hypothetical protein B0H10DRAFT_1940587 [Mycena sp. CBHHK59/15]|nr:hypothetical protein B0H10DRAFT_1940587 [Mycena sp. CBHHK59/15]